MNIEKLHKQTWPGKHPFLANIIVASGLIGSLALFAFLIGCSSTSTSPNASTTWTQTYGHDVTLKPYGNQGFTFNFQQAEPHYITKPSGLLKIGQNITVTYLITGSGFATVEKNTGKPCFHVMFQKGNDMWSQFGRYWFSPMSLALKATSKTTFTIAIQPELWTDVYGAKGIDHLAEFKSALEGGHIGLTFGGETGGYGHGVTGKGTFTLVSFTVK